MKSCYECRRAPATRGPLCDACYSVVARRPEWQQIEGVIGLKLPFTVSGGTVWAATIEPVGVMEYYAVDAPLTPICAVTVEDLYFTNRPTSSQRYTWELDGQGTGLTPGLGTRRGSVFRLSEEILGTCRDKLIAAHGPIYQAQSWIRRERPIATLPLFEEPA